MSPAIPKGDPNHPGGPTVRIESGARHVEDPGGPPPLVSPFVSHIQLFLDDPRYRSIHEPLGELLTRVQNAPVTVEDEAELKDLLEAARMQPTPALGSAFYRHVQEIDRQVSANAKVVGFMVQSDDVTREALHILAAKLADQLWRQHKKTLLALVSGGQIKQALVAEIVERLKKGFQR